MLAIAWLAGLADPALAQPHAPENVPRGHLKFRVFGGADGLRNTVINSITQDRDGLLWIGNDDGVERFDGETFTHFSLGDGLVSSATIAVGIAPDGAVCVGANKGLVCWDGARFSRAKTQGIPEIPVHAMASFGGRFWVGTAGGLYVRGANGSFTHAPGWPGAPTAAVRALWVDASGVVASDGPDVWLTSGNDQWASAGHIGLERDLVFGVLRDLQGALWIRTSSHTWRVPRGATRGTDLQDGLPPGYDAINAAGGMAIGPRGDVLLATDNGIASREGDHWRIIDRSVGLPVAGARMLFVDREGTIWLGSIGLIQLRGRGMLELYDAPSGLPGSVVWSFQRDAQGTLWVGTDRCLARAVGGRWICLPGTEGRVVRSFVFPPQGGVFVGGAPSDVLYIDPAGHPLSLGDLHQPGAHNILALALGPEGDLWIGTKHGLYRRAGARPGPPERVAIPGTRDDVPFPSFAIAGAQLWTASADGVLVFDHGAWHVFDQRAGFRGTAMRHVIARRDGRMCAGYQDALGATCFRYDGHTVSQLEHIGTAQGLTTDKVYFLGEDAAQRLWIGTGDGVDIVTPTGFDHFDESDGLSGNDSTSNAFIVDRDDSLWLGSTGGATHVFAQHYHGPPHAPRTMFIAGRLGDRSIREAYAGIELAHDHNALTLELASSSVLDAKRVEFQMRISPLETEWTTTRQRQTHYLALQPGTYHFEARARIGGGHWGQISELRFAVLPAWWQTRWFYASLALTGAALIGGLVTWRQRTLLRRRTGQLNARTEASFRAVIDLMPDLISVHRGGKLIYLNLAHRRFLGVEDAGDRWDEVKLQERVHPDDHGQVKELFARARGVAPALASEVVELRMRSADGSWRTCEVAAIIVEIAGAPTIVASGRDVTERKRMRAKLLVSDRMASLGTLAAGIAHEINNPLAYVTGNLEVMAEAVEAARASTVPTDYDELSAVIIDARDGAERVRKIVLGLRSFSRSEEEAARSSLALPDVLDAAIRMTNNEIRHRAQLVRELGATPLVVADDGRLTQVFINLLVNASHAIPEGRSDAHQITVRTRTDDQGRAVVEIEDTGKGMPPEVQSRVFDPFFTTKDVGEGTGLGLSICHGIITALGGQIAIESATGRGTIVRVVLPPQVAAPAIAAVAAPESVGPTGQARARVMLVDDEPLVAETIGRLLRRDYDVTVALCGEDAMKHITGGVRFDAVVSDVMMPNMTGIELVEELRRVAPDQAERLIFLSGGAFTAQTRERLDELGVPQLVKPVTAKELRACVARIAHGTGPASSRAASAPELKRASGT